MAVCQTVVPVSESSQVGEARRIAVRLAQQAGMGEADTGKVAIVVTELGNNLARHAKSGELLLRAFDTPGGAAVETISLDRGPGMDVARCMEDGFSTGGTAGTGLGAVERLSGTFDVYAQSTGTVVVSRVAATPARGATTPAAENFEWGAVCVPAPGETACGDLWATAAADGQLSVMLADGLGHGPLAADAALAAEAAFRADAGGGVKAFIERAHDRMRGTRGGALAAAAVDTRGRTVRFAGVGNISAALVSAAGSRGLMSHNGTAGVQMRKVQELDYPWPDDGMLVMHSDGLQTRWTLGAYPGAVLRHPAVVAALLYRDFKRGRDDATILAVRPARPGGVSG
jgi:anti-sigma regulatory factor (Ser/Thr protein kinase)